MSDRRDKYRKTIIEKYGSWENYIDQRRNRFYDKYGSKEDYLEEVRRNSSKGGKNTPSRPFRDNPRLASRAGKMRWNKDADSEDMS